MDDSYNLERFVQAQDSGSSYQNALQEIRNGRKSGHWIWWVFPQLAGLGRSPTSRDYSITSLYEARAYLGHPLLGSRLREAASAMTSHVGRTATSILNGDDIKFRSSMTLFMRASPADEVFREAIEQFFHGEPDALTDSLLRETGTKDQDFGRAGS